MQQNLLTNPYLPFTLNDLLFEKQTILEPIANNMELSAARRADTLTRIVLVDQVLGLFEGAIQNDLVVEEKTGIQLVEEVYGKSVEELAKTPGMLSKAGEVAKSSSQKAKVYLNRFAGWVAEKTKEER